MGSRRSAVACLAVVLVLLTPGGGNAAAPGDASSEEVRALAARAVDDPTALARLRDVRRIDGVPADMGVVLGDASGEPLRARLRVMAAPSSTAGGAPAVDARGTASRILEQRRFRAPSQPRPLRGFFRWLGRLLAPVLHRLRFLRPLGRPFAIAWDAVTTNRWWALLAGGSVIVAAALLSVRLVRRRGRRLVSERSGHRDGARNLDPDELDRRADEAAGAGRFDDAFRLRFVAGLVRLDRAGVVELRPSLTSGALRRRVASPTLRDLTVRFDEIVYGGDQAGQSDDERAKEQWPRALQEVGA